LSSDFVDVNNPTEILIYSETRTTPREKYNLSEQTVTGFPTTVNFSSNDLAGTSGANIVANLGSQAGTGLRAVFRVDNLTNLSPQSVKTRAQYNLQELVAGDVSGKTFTFTDMLPNDQGVFESGTVMFNANLTGSITVPGEGTFDFDWSIGADTITNAAWGGTGHQYNTLILSWADGENDVIYGTDLGNGSFIIGDYTKDTNNADAIISVNATLLTAQ